MRRRLGRRRLGDAPPRARARTPASAPSGGVRADSIIEPSCGATGATARRSPARAPATSAPQARARVGQVAPSRARRGASSSGASASDALKSTPRPAKPGAEPVDASAAAPARRRLVEGVDDLVEVDDRLRLRRAPARPPASIVLPRLPGLSSRYLRPSGERGRTVTCVSSGSGSSVLSSFSARRATARPRAARPRVISSITPTRLPPIRTSLPATSPAASGTCTVTS